MKQNDNNPWFSNIWAYKYPKIKKTTTAINNHIKIENMQTPADNSNNNNNGI